MPEKAVFRYSGNVFFNECFILGFGNGYSGKYKINFFSSSENVFFDETFIPAIREGFSLYWKPSAFLERSFLLAKTVTNMSGNHFLKTDLILASGNSFSS